MHEISAIYSRRSVRAFKPEQLKQSELDSIIDSGLWAPSSMNAQDWHFTIVQNTELLDRINAQVRSMLPEDFKARMTERNNGNENFSVFYFAPTVVFVSAPKNNTWAIANCSFATQNMVLTAEALGIGSCIVGMVSMLFESPEAEQYIKELGLPENYKPLYAISFGYKGMDMPKPERIPGKVNTI